MFATKVQYKTYRNSAEMSWPTNLSPNERRMFVCYRPNIGIYLSSCRILVRDIGMWAHYMHVHGCAFKVK